MKNRVENGLAVLNDTEMENVNGGWIQAVLGFIGGAILGDIVTDPVGAIDAFKRGMDKAMEGRN